MEKLLAKIYSCLLFFFTSILILQLKEAQHIPTYYIDPEVLKIFQPRTESCLHASGIGYNSEQQIKTLLDKELQQLPSISASDFFRSHEIIAHSYFTRLDNPHRRSKYEDAELEYIPLLPFSWRVINAFAKASSLKNKPMCTYSRLIQDIVSCAAYLEKRDKMRGANSTSLPRFAVASTYNMRTQMGFGMPTQVRRGAVWTTVSSFVMDLSIGHYERWPQCPDLVHFILRKSWRYVVEMPYVPISEVMSTAALASAAAVVPSRDVVFHFSGHFDLYGPELVCSVRQKLLEVAAGRPDLVVQNASITVAAYSPVKLEVLHAIQRSIFCLILRGDSYSSSLFYHAIALGCVPVVISDWFVFSFPWIVPYERFVVRISEDDFVKNPNLALDSVKKTFLDPTRPALLQRMRDSMAELGQLLSYRPIAGNSPIRKRLLALDPHLDLSGSLTSADTILPLDLLLLELRYERRPHSLFNNIPCTRPYMCFHDKYNNLERVKPRVIPYVEPGSLSQAGKDYTFYKPITESSASGQRWMLRPYSADFQHSPPKESSDIYKLKDIGYQVNPIRLDAVPDLRSHLCVHATRLIGQYRMVFYMQCVRILWPLQPGQFKPVDRAEAVVAAAASSGAASSTRQGITFEEKTFVQYLHNISARPPGWNLHMYPLVQMGSSNDKGRLEQLGRN